MQSEFDAISNERKESSPSPAFIPSEVISRDEVTSRRRENEWEDPAYKTTGSIISDNAKMFFVLFSMFAYFMTLSILKAVGVLSGNTVFFLSLPPLAVVIVAYLIFRRNRGWNSKN